MKNRYLISLISILIVLSYIFHLNQNISEYISNVSNTIKIFYISTKNNIVEKFSNYYHQKHTIEALNKELKTYKRYKIIYDSYDQNLSKKLNNSIQKLDVISYVNFNDFSKVFLDKNDIKLDINSSKILPLLTEDGFVAGIARMDNFHLIGLLNHNQYCNYAVFIGKNLVPGITKGDKYKQYITVEYIPLWQKINIGDEVVTSGMDNIFPNNIKVGKVVEIKALSQTQEAKIKLYANDYNNRSFYLVNKL